MSVSQNRSYIYRAYAECAWHSLGFRVFAESIIYGISYLCSVVHHYVKLCDLHAAAVFSLC